jgi:two-component sensor histidine kinase
MASGSTGEAVIEPSPSGATEDVTMRALRHRIRQQEILAEIGVEALQGAAFDTLLADVARMTAEGLRTEFCKVLEHIPSEDRLLVRAGYGWGPGVVGVATVGADLASPAGFALRTGKPVISNHLANEERFRTPEILQRFGVHRAMNVILQGDGQPYGVLEVDSRSDDKFIENDLAFLQGAANILGMAIERERREQNLRAALERHEFLLKEMNHRVKNSLAIVASMLNLQASDVDDPGTTAQLEEASHRITAVAKAHDQLYRGSDLEHMDVGAYVESLCADLDASVSQCTIVTEAQKGIEISTDRAISSALIVNELITNAAKYAYQGQPGGEILVRIAREDADKFSISVRDKGAGLPADFNPRKARGLGMRIIRSLSSQLNGELAIHHREPGAEFVVVVPINA